MTKRPKTGGRTAGTPNKKTLAFRAGLKAVMERNNYDPYEALVRLAESEETTLEVKISIHRLLLKYTYSEKSPVPEAQEQPDSQVMQLVMDGRPPVNR